MIATFKCHFSLSEMYPALVKEKQNVDNYYDYIYIYYIYYDTLQATR